MPPPPPRFLRLCRTIFYQEWIQNRAAQARRTVLAAVVRGVLRPVSKGMGRSGVRFTAAAACPWRLRCEQPRYRQSEGQLLTALRQVAESTGRVPSRREWDRLEPGHSHSTTLGRRFGGWRRAICAAGLENRAW